MAPPKSKHKYKPRHHHERSMVRRNDSEVPADVLFDLAPIQPSFGPIERPKRSYRRKAADFARALKPQGATITKDHLMGVGANAAGAVGAALAVNEFVDNLGAMSMAVGATVAGGLGSAMLTGRWQQVAQGVLGAGFSQLATAHLVKRGLKKATTVAPATPAAAAAAPVKRNGYLPAGDGDRIDEDALVRAMNRTERRIDDMLAAERNGAGYDDRDPYGGAYGVAVGDGYGPVFIG